MTQFKIGSTFRDGPAKWTVLERYANFVLVERDSPKLWAISNVFQSDGEERISSPIKGTIERDSPYYDKMKIKAFFDDQVLKLQADEKSKTEQMENKKVNEKKLEQWKEKLSALTTRKNELKGRFQQLINSTKNAEGLLQNKELISVSNEISLIDNILKFNKL